MSSRCGAPRRYAICPVWQVAQSVAEEADANTRHRGSVTGRLRSFTLLSSSPAPVCRALMCPAHPRQEACVPREVFATAARVTDPIEFAWEGGRLLGRSVALTASAGNDNDPACRLGAGRGAVYQCMDIYLRIRVCTTTGAGFAARVACSTVQNYRVFVWRANQRRMIAQVVSRPVSGCHLVHIGCLEACAASCVHSTVGQSIYRRVQMRR